MPLEALTVPAWERATEEEILAALSAPKVGAAFLAWCGTHRPLLVLLAGALGLRRGREACRAVAHA
jgi:hypothetical protein